MEILNPSRKQPKIVFKSEFLSVIENRRSSEKVASTYSGGSPFVILSAAKDLAEIFSRRDPSLRSG